MHNFTRAIPVAVAFALWAGASNADQFTEDVIATLQEMGFDYIEVKEGITQQKVEAIQGSDKYEVIYDRATGAILKQETERADADEIGRSGVEIDRRALCDKGVFNAGHRGPARCKRRHHKGANQRDISKGRCLGAITTAQPVYR